MHIQLYQTENSHYFQSVNIFTRNIKCEYFACKILHLIYLGIRLQMSQFSASKLLPLSKKKKMLLVYSAEIISSGLAFITNTQVYFPKHVHNACLAPPSADRHVLPSILCDKQCATCTEEQQVSENLHSLIGLQRCKKMSQGIRLHNDRGSGNNNNN